MKTTHNPDDINLTEWSELALSSTFSSAFQTPESHRLFTSCPEFTTFFTAVTDDSNHIKGLICGAIHRNGCFPFNLLTRRAIVYGGPLLSPDISDDELLALLNATTSFLKHKAIYLEIRFSEDYSRFHEVFRKANIKPYISLDAIIDTSSHEVIARNIQKRKHCKIRAALRNDIEFVENPTSEDITAFYPRLKSLHWRVSHKPMPSLDFFLKLAKSPIGVVTLLKHNGKIIAFNASVSLVDRKFYLLYSIGEDRLQKQLAPSAVALFKLLNLAADRHIPLCDLMGAGNPSKPYGVRDFKIRMGATTPDYKRARKFFCPLVYDIATLFYDQL
ncbi:MAG: hypothetical protein MJ001_07765 [Paludibacteraceae bacterium]|nr:hypothetical protein [Paludibacteraceae bacterium]